MRVPLCLGAMLAVVVGIVPMAQEPPPLVFTRAIPLPNVEGRIDHLAFDAARNRLFVAALGNNSVEVVDTAKMAHLTHLAGFHEPQGIAVVPDFNVVAVANGDTGTVQLIDRDAYETKHLVTVGGDADNVRYDAAAKQVYVAYEGGLAVVETASGKVTRRIAIPGHPESFQLEPAGVRVFANLPRAGQVVVADRQTGKVTDRWPSVTSRANYPMALDEPNRRLFVGCRQPSSLVVYDTVTGKITATVPAVGDTDDLFFDAARKRVYVIGGEGYVDVLQSDVTVPIRRLSRISTAADSRTGLFVSEQNRLYVAVPHRGNQQAEIRIYEAQN